MFLCILNQNVICDSTIWDYFHEKQLCKIKNVLEFRGNFES